MDIDDDECRQFLAVCPEVEEGGVHTANREVRREEEFNLSSGGTPTNSEAICESVAQQWRDMHCDNILRRRLV